MNAVFRRWLYFAGAAVLSGLLLFWLSQELTVWSAISGAFGPGFCLGMALIGIRKMHPKAKAINYVLLLSFLFLILNAFGAILVIAPTPIWIAIIALPSLGALMAVITGAGYGNFLIQEHPSIAELAAFGAAGVLIPFLIVTLFTQVYHIDLHGIEPIFIIMTWFGLVGYSFSKDTEEDVASDKHLLSLINKIGNKGRAQ